MTDPRFPNFKYPEGRSPLLVRVFNLSPSSEEHVVKDFFRFCGKIDDFAMIKTKSGDSLEALICFEKEGAAKTALMLTNATIGDRVVKVEPYYKDQEEEASQNNSKDASESARGNQDAQSNSEAPTAASSYFNSIWSTGYQLSQTVFHGAKTLDSTYGISTQAAAYLEKAKEETKKLDEKYRVSERAVEIDTKLGIRDRLNQAVSTASVLGKQALETEQGKKVHGLYEKAASTASDLRTEALRAINLDVNQASSNNQDATTSDASSSAGPSSSNQTSYAEKAAEPTKVSEKSPPTESAKPSDAN